MAVGGCLHSQAHGLPPPGRVLAWSLAATSAFVVIELVAGIRAQSLALISDAGHNATDALALLLAWFAVFIQYKPARTNPALGVSSGRRSCRIRKNAIVLIGLTAWMFYESVRRLMTLWWWASMRP